MDQSGYFKKDYHEKKTAMGTSAHPFFQPKTQRFWS